MFYIYVILTGGGSVDLIKGGGQVEVAPDNVHDYVKKYAEFRMILNARRSLQVCVQVDTSVHGTSL